jgi:hypothetical protein
VPGRGFPRAASRNAVSIGGVRALIVSAADDELKVVVPHLPAGEEARPLEVRMAGTEHVGGGTLRVSVRPVVEFLFTAEPFDAAYGKSHAVLATALGPAFVLAAAGGKTAAERALLAQRRLNDAGAVLAATRGLSFEVRTPETSPTLALVGRPELLLEVTEEDAAAYNEDWTGLKARARPVTRLRLARWWEAVARDLALMLVRGERPQFAAALAPEGRVLGEVSQAGQRMGGTAIPLAVVAEAKPAVREALRVLAFRVPPTVPGPTSAVEAPPPVPTAAGSPAATVAPLRLEGVWVGSEVEESLQRDLTATFRAGLGTIAYEGTVTLTVPLRSLEQPQKNSARFSVEYRGGIRHYLGRWDGQTLSGVVARDPAGREVVAQFTLRPR